MERQVAAAEWRTSLSYIPINKTNLISRWCSRRALPPQVGNQNPSKTDFLASSPNPALSPLACLPPWPRWCDLDVLEALQKWIWGYLHATRKELSHLFISPHDWLLSLVSQCFYPLPVSLLQSTLASFGQCQKPWRDMTSQCCLQTRWYSTLPLRSTKHLICLAFFSPVHVQMNHCHTGMTIVQNIMNINFWFKK